MSAEIISIHITDTAGGTMQTVPQAHLVPGRGIEGDRYFARTGSYSDKPGEGRELTLIESEALERLEAATGIYMDPRDSRRNVVTRGVALNDLVGVTFRLGAVTVRGVRRCDPCSHLESLTAPGVLAGLVNQGGLRADILSEGIIRPGDGINIIMGH